MIDIDSTICEVSGYQKQGAAYGYTKKLGYHPLLAVRSDTGEVLHQRMLRAQQTHNVELSAFYKSSLLGVDSRSLAMGQGVHESTHDISGTQASSHIAHLIWL